MKNILFIIVMLLLASCTEATKENSIEDPESFTTIKLQQSTKDTILVSYYDDNTLYVWKDDLIVEQYNIKNNDSVILPFGAIFFLIVATGIIFIALVIVTSKQ